MSQEHLEKVSSPELVGMCSHRLKKLDHWAKSKVNTGEMPFIVVQVARRGKLIFNTSYGTANSVTGHAAGPDTIMRFFSMTKTITSVAIMMLYENSAFQLTDPIEKYLPCFKNMRVLLPNSTIENPITVPATTKITIKHLLTHTSGLMYGEGLSSNDILGQMYHTLQICFNYDLSSFVEERGKISLKEMVEKLATLPLLSQPGKRWTYSLSVDVLGRLVEVISGLSLRDFFLKKIFQPLGMVDTDFFVPHDREKAKRFAMGFVKNDHQAFPYVDKPVRKGSFGKLKLLFEGIPGKDIIFEKETRLTLCSGGGGLASTTRDYMRFAQCLLNKGELDGFRLLGRKTVEYMMRDHMGGKDMEEMGAKDWLGLNRSGQGFGLGGSVILDPGKFSCVCSKGEFGWSGAINTFYWIDPLEEIVTTMNTQLLTEDRRFRREVRNLVYQSVIDNGKSTLRNKL